MNIPATPTPTEVSCEHLKRETESALVDHQEAVHARKQDILHQAQLEAEKDMKALDAKIAKAAEQKEHTKEIIKDKATALLSSLQGNVWFLVYCQEVQDRHALKEEYQEYKKMAEFQHHQIDQALADERREAILKGIQEKQYRLQHHGQSPWSLYVNIFLINNASKRVQFLLQKMSTATVDLGNGME